MPLSHSIDDDRMTGTNTSRPGSRADRFVLMVAELALALVTIALLTHSRPSLPCPVCSCQATYGPPVVMGRSDERCGVCLQSRASR